MTIDPLKLQHEIDQQEAFWRELTAEHKRVGLAAPGDYTAKGACKPLFAELMRRGELERMVDIGKKLTNVITVLERLDASTKDGDL